MSLKCKLQKSAQPILHRTSEKVITGLVQTSSLFNFSQLFYFLSIFGLIGFLIWLLQPSNNNNSNNNDDDENNKKETENDINQSDSSSDNKNEDENQDNDQFFINQNLLKKRYTNKINKSNSASSLNKYPIETIYESSNELEQQQEEIINKISSSNLSLNIINQEEKANLDLNKSHVLQKQDSTSSKTPSTEETGSHNSLLELYNAKHLHAIEDHFKNLDEVSNAIKTAGLENSQLIFGIDFTISNLENGLRTFNGRSLHFCDEEILNPYQKVIEIFGKTLECFDVDGRIPAFGFGDTTTKDRKVFSFSPNYYCYGFKDVLKRYNEILKEVKLSGPTNFAPLIKEAIKIVKETKQYHILVIVADGQVTNERQTRDAIVEASKYALSIIMVGVGDGPWDTMNEFDDSLPKRQFDNFQFVNYHEVIEGSDNPDETFALHALMEIPDQYKAIKELKLLD